MEGREAWGGKDVHDLLELKIETEMIVGTLGKDKEQLKMV